MSDSLYFVLQNRPKIFGRFGVNCNKLVITIEYNGLTVLKMLILMLVYYDFTISYKDIATSYSDATSSYNGFTTLYNNAFTTYIMTTSNKDDNNHRMKLPLHVIIFHFI